MVLVNYTTRELTAKLVYYGPGLCGKTTNLQFIFDNLLPKDRRGKMVSLSTETDRTLFFDFLPLELGTIRGLKTRLQLYTVPGQVHYNATRKIVLKGADGIVFVADSQATARASNIESYKNMKANLAEHGIDLRTIPHVFQFNKRDLQNIMPVDEMVEDLNEYNVPFWEAVAVQGIGVEDTLKGITRLVMKGMAQRFAGEAVKEPEATPAAPVARAATPAPEPAPPAVVAPVVAEPAAVEEPLEILDVGDAMLLDDEAPAESAQQPFASFLDAPSPPATPFELEAAELLEEPEVVPESAPEVEADAVSSFEAGDTVHSAEGLEGLLQESDVASRPEASPLLAEELELEAVDVDEQTMIAPEPVADAFPEEIMLSGDTLLSSEGFDGLPSEADLGAPAAPVMPAEPAWSPDVPIGTPDLLAEEMSGPPPPMAHEVFERAPSPAAPAGIPHASLPEPEVADVSVPVDLRALERGEVVERTVEVPLEIPDGRGGTRRVVLAIKLRLDVR